MSLAVLILFCLGSQSSGSPHPSPEADPYRIEQTVEEWINFEGNILTAKGLQKKAPT